ncbi:unnamed protein product, partial [Rotaria magnacalcarata]
MSTEVDNNKDIHSNEEVQQDNNEIPQEIDQPLHSFENEQKIESSINDKQLETQSSPLSTCDNEDNPLKIPSTDVNNEEDAEGENSTAATVSEENSSALPLSEDDNTTSDTVQLESLNQSDDTHQLLQTIADKSNKEASLTILNTLVEGDFDLDKNYIIQKPKKFYELFTIFDKMSSSLQAEILSVIIGVMRKSERNLLASIDAQIYGIALELLNRID